MLKLPDMSMFPLTFVLFKKLILLFAASIFNGPVKVSTEFTANLILPVSTRSPSI